MHPAHKSSLWEESYGRCSPALWHGHWWHLTVGTAEKGHVGWWSSKTLLFPSVPVPETLGQCPWTLLSLPWGCLGVSLLHPTTVPFWAAKCRSGSWALVQSLTWKSARGIGLYWGAVAARQGEGTGVFLWDWFYLCAPCIGIRLVQHGPPGCDGAVCWCQPLRWHRWCTWDTAGILSPRGHHC